MPQTISGSITNIYIGGEKVLFNEEALLIYKIRENNDRTAADQLIRNYYKEIYGYVYRQIGNKEISMDLTQDIFISVLQSIAFYESSKGTFRTWLYRISTNKIIDYFRSRSFKEMTVTLNLDDIVAAGEEDVFTIVSSRETTQKITAMVSEFDMVSNEIFRLKLFGEYTFLQISELLHLNESTVKTKYYTMIKKIRKELEADEYREN